MFSICLCDDNRLFLSALEQKIAEILEEKSIEYTIHPYDSPLALMHVIQHNVGQFDLYVLDMEMDELHGMVLLKEIRKLDKYRSVIIMTNYMKYSYEGYDYNLTTYLLKDQVDKSARLETALQNAYNRSKHSELLIRTGGYSRVLNYSEIVYIVKAQKYAEYHLTDGSIIAVRRSLKDLSDDLPDALFAFASRGMIVNITKVYTIDADTITLDDGSTVRATGQHLKQITDRFTQYWSKQSVPD